MYSGARSSKSKSLQQASPQRLRYPFIEDRCYQNQQKHAAAAVHSSPSKPKIDYVDWSSSSTGPPTKQRKSLKQHDPFASPPRRVSLAVEQKEKILSLTELNNSLLKEVTSLQTDKSSLAERVNTLESELRSISDKIAGLEHDKRELEAKFNESREELAEREREIQKLTSEKRAIEREKLELLDIKGTLETQLVDSDRKVRECSRRAEEAEAVVRVAVDEIDGLGNRLQQQSFVSEIAKKMELNGLQSCKGALRKELKRFSGMVMKAKEEVGEAKEVIHTLRSQETESKEEKAKLERELEVTIEKSQELERQERSLSSHIRVLEVKVVELERELRASKAEQCRATTEASAASAMCASEQGLDAVRRSIQVLKENSRSVLHLQQQIGRNPDLNSARAGLEHQMKEIMGCSMEAMVKAEEQLVQLKQEVEGLNAAFAVAKDASQESQKDVWEAVRRLGREDSWIPHIPASATYILALGLFAYAIYSSSSSDR